MKTCNRCGARIEDDVKICPYCSNKGLEQINDDSNDLKSNKKPFDITLIMDSLIFVICPLFFVFMLFIWSFCGNRKNEGGEILGFVYKGYDIYFFVISIIMFFLELIGLFIITRLYVKKENKILILIYFISLLICIFITAISFIHYIRGI